MNILYINHYAGSISLGMEFRQFYLAREWEKLGHHVRVITASFAHLRKHNPEVSKDFEIHDIDGIEHQWIKTDTYHTNGIKRAKTIFQFVGKLWLHAKKIAADFKPDLVISSSTYPVDSYAAYRIAKIANAYYYHEIHDLWPLTLILVSEMSKYHPFTMLMAHGEHYAYSHADKVVSILPCACEHCLKHGMRSKDNFIAVPNGIVVNDWKNPENLPCEHQELFRKLRDEKRFIVLYVGAMMPSYSLDALLDAAKIISQDLMVSFVLIGPGMEKERLIKRVETENIKNVSFLPPITKKAIPIALASADALYAGLKDSPLYRYGVSMNKVYDYMMSGKPIIYAVNAGNNDVDTAGCGITVQTDSGISIVSAIEKLKSMNENERIEMGHRGKEWVIENCSYENLAKKFLNSISNK